MLRTRTTRTGILLCALVALLAVGPASLAQEVGDPQDAVGELTDSVKQATGGGGGPNTAPRAPSQTTPAAAPSAPTQDDDSGAHETADPEPPDHAGGSVVDLDVLGKDTVDVASTNAEVEEDGKASGDVTVLAIGGEEIVGSHSNSRQGPENDSVAPFDALCEESEGGVCVGLLFADTTSTENENQSSAESDAALAFACIGGDQPDSGASCDGLLSAGVVTSNSQVTQNNQTGATSAEQETTLADVCAGGENPQTGACEGVGAEVLRAESQSQAPAQNADGTSSRASCTADIQVGGEGNCVIEDPQVLELPPGCLAGESLLCLYLNQGETFIFTGGGGSRQEALHARILPGAIEGNDLVGLHLATAETLATNTGAVLGAPGGPPNEGVLGGGGGPEGAGGPGGPPELAFTGFDLVQFLTVLLVLAVAGLAMLALDRRRAVLA